MHPITIDHAAPSRLRFVFKDKVVSFGVRPHVTLGEIAQRFDEISIREYGSPVAIDVTLNRARRTALFVNCCLS